MNTKHVRDSIYTLLSDRGSSDDCEYFADIVGDAETREERELILKVYEQTKEAFITDWWEKRQPDGQRELVELLMNEIRKNL